MWKAISIYIRRYKMFVVPLGSPLSPGPACDIGPVQQIVFPSTAREITEAFERAFLSAGRTATLDEMKAPSPVIVAAGVASWAEFNKGAHMWSVSRTEWQSSKPDGSTESHHSFVFADYAGKDLHFASDTPLAEVAHAVFTRWHAFHEPSTTKGISIYLRHGIMFCIPYGHPPDGGANHAINPVQRILPPLLPADVGRAIEVALEVTGRDMTDEEVDAPWVALEAAGVRSVHAFIKGSRVCSLVQTPSDYSVFAESPVKGGGFVGRSGPEFKKIIPRDASFEDVAKAVLEMLEKCEEHWGMR